MLIHRPFGKARKCTNCLFFYLHFFFLFKNVCVNAECIIAKLNMVSYLLHWESIGVGVLYFFPIKFILSLLLFLRETTSNIAIIWIHKVMNLEFWGCSLDHLEYPLLTQSHMTWGWYEWLLVNVPLPVRSQLNHHRKKKWWENLTPL